MNIVVLCGGTSTERDISLISSEGICKALNTKRHKAILLDVFLGDDTLDTEHLFSQEQYDVDAVLADIRKRSEQLEQIKAQRKEFFGPNVMEACRKADVVFLGLHGANGEDGKVQAVLDLLNCIYRSRLSFQCHGYEQIRDKADFPGDTCTDGKGNYCSKGKTIPAIICL